MHKNEETLANTGGGEPEDRPNTGQYRERELYSLRSKI